MQALKWRLHHYSTLVTNLIKLLFSPIIQDTVASRSTSHPPDHHRKKTNKQTATCVPLWKILRTWQHISRYWNHYRYLSFSVGYVSGKFASQSLTFSQLSWIIQVSLNQHDLVETVPKFSISHDGSMYAIFYLIYHRNQPNDVGKYTYIVPMDPQWLWTSPPWGPLGSPVGFAPSLERSWIRCYENIPSVCWV